MVGHNSRTIGRKKRAFQLAKEYTLVTLMPIFKLLTPILMF